VIVRWRAMPINSQSLSIRVIKPVDASNFLVERSSDAASIAGNAGVAPVITSVPTRIPIDAGDYVALAIHTGANVGSITAAGSTYQQLNNIGVPDGSTTPKFSDVAGQVPYDADIEPDFDHDGFGDVTQDFCPTDSTTQLPCLAHDSSPPVITQFKMLFKSFRVKPKGLVISNRAHPGTTVSLNLSEPSTVAFTVEKAFRGKITNGVCKKAGKTNRKNRRCTKYILVHTFSRSIDTGVNSFPYSGRYSSDSKVGTLKPGPYRLTALPTDVAGNVGAPKTVAFKIRH